LYQRKIIEGYGLASAWQEIPKSIFPALIDTIRNRILKFALGLKDDLHPFATAKPDVRLIKLLISAHRFNATLARTGGMPFAALAKQEGVSPSYFTRLLRLSYLAPDITQAILDGRQPSHLTADKLLAHSRLPLVWRDQRTALGFS
jgi:hypothetical protein